MNQWHQSNDEGCGTTDNKHTSQQCAGKSSVLAFITNKQQHNKLLAVAMICQLPISFAAVDAPTITDRFGAIKLIRDST